jgi:hypothetical protein
MTTLVEPGILALLQASEALVEVVSTRIYSGWLPQSTTYPAVCFFEVSGGEVAEAKVGRYRFQVSSFAADDITAKQASNAIIDALKGYSGISGGVEIPKIIYLSRTRLREDETNLYHYATDFQIMYTGE